MTSLRELDRVEDRIRQHRQVDSRPVLIVEGPDDLLVLKHHVKVETIFPGDGKKNVLRAVAALREWSTPGVRAVVDADFDEEVSDDQVMTYEARDLEGMLIELGVLDLVLEHRGSAEKLDAAGGVVAVRKDLVSKAMFIAKLRAANARDSWGLPFDHVDVASKTDRRTMALDAGRYCSALIAAGRALVDLDTLLSAGDADLSDHRGPRGRDVVSLAGVALRHHVGTLPKAACEESGLSAQLRSSAAFLLERSEWLAALRRMLKEASAELPT